MMMFMAGCVIVILGIISGSLKDIAYELYTIRKIIERKEE